MPAADLGLSGGITLAAEPGVAGDPLKELKEATREREREREEPECLGSLDAAMSLKRNKLLY